MRPSPRAGPLKGKVAHCQTDGPGSPLRTPQSEDEQHSTAPQPLTGALPPSQNPSSKKHQQTPSQSLQGHPGEDSTSHNSGICASPGAAGQETHFQYIRREQKRSSTLLEKPQAEQQSCSAPQCGAGITQLPGTLKQEDDKFKASLHNLDLGLNLRGSCVLEMAQG